MSDMWACFAAVGLAAVIFSPIILSEVKDIVREWRREK